jgi:hypothetical protein
MAFLLILPTLVRASSSTKRTSLGHREARDVARLGKARDGGLDLVGRGRLPGQDDQSPAAARPIGVLDADHRHLADRRCWEMMSSSSSEDTIRRRS